MFLKTGQKSFLTEVSQKLPFSTFELLQFCGKYNYGPKHNLWHLHLDIVRTSRHFLWRKKKLFKMVNAWKRYELMQEEFPTNFLSMIQDNVPIMCTSSLFGFNTKSKSCLAPCHIMEKAHWNTQCIVNGICEIEIDVKELGHYHTTPPPDLVVGL